MRTLKIYINKYLYNTFKYESDNIDFELIKNIYNKNNDNWNVFYNELINKLDLKDLGDTKETNNVIYISINKDHIIINDGSKVKTYYNINNIFNNCVNTFIYKNLKSKISTINEYINVMTKDMNNRATELSYHKSQYFDKDLSNLRNIKNECKDIINKIDKLIENLTFDNYTE